MRRLLLLAAVLLPSCTTPSLVAPTKPDFVAEVVIPNPGGDVRAFRIDVGEREQPSPKARYTLSTIAIDERGLIHQQYRRTFIGIGRDFGDYTVLVRAYRPGYLTIDIKPGEETRWLQWVRADPFEQEMAIDVLLGVQRRSGKAGWWELTYQGPQSELDSLGISRSADKFLTLGDQGLQPGSVAKEHREVLLFAASEYERLSRDAAEPESRARLKAKASQIKRYADELTTEEVIRRRSEAASP